MFCHVSSLKKFCLGWGRGRLGGVKGIGPFTGFIVTSFLYNTVISDAYGVLLLLIFNDVSITNLIQAGLFKQKVGLMDFHPGSNAFSLFFSIKNLKFVGKKTLKNCALVKPV